MIIIIYINIRNNNYAVGRVAGGLGHKKGGCKIKKEKL